MHKALHLRGDIDRLYEYRNEESVNTSIQRLRQHYKEQREINYIDQKQHRQHKQDNEKGRKTTVWVFQTTNWQNLTQGSLDMAKNNETKCETQSLRIAAQKNAIRTN